MLSAALRPLDRPALVVWGRKDPYLPVEQAERQRETFPRARVVVLRGWGNLPECTGRARPVSLGGLRWLGKRGEPCRRGSWSPWRSGRC
jgi:hypothetical protein